MQTSPKCEGPLLAIDQLLRSISHRNAPLIYLQKIPFRPDFIRIYLLKSKVCVDMLEPRSLKRQPSAERETEKQNDRQ